jgi:hypothetical protein
MTTRSTRSHYHLRVPTALTQGEMKTVEAALMKRLAPGLE